MLHAWLRIVRGPGPASYSSGRWLRGRGEAWTRQRAEPHHPAMLPDVWALVQQESTARVVLPGGCPRAAGAPGSLLVTIR
jgi:hypothetical protein